MLRDLIAHGHAVRLVSSQKPALGLFCMASGAGFESRKDEAYAWDSTRRGTSPFVVLQHTISGRGRLDHAGAPHVLRPGDTMISTVPHNNRYWLERGASWEYFWLVVHGREALRIMGAVLDQAGPVLRLPPQSVDRLASACLAVLAEPDPLPGRISAAAYAATMAVYDAVFGESPPAEREVPATIARAQSYMERNLGEPLDVGRAAAAAGLSRAHFTRLFTRSLGVPPSSYLFKARMARAARLLHATDQPVAAIARECGFSDGNYFAKAFRRFSGVSPSVYRADPALGAGMLRSSDGAAAP